MSIIYSIITLTHGGFFPSCKNDNYHYYTIWAHVNQHSWLNFQLTSIVKSTIPFQFSKIDRSTLHWELVLETVRQFKIVFSTNSCDKCLRNYFQYFCFGTFCFLDLKDIPDIMKILKVDLPYNMLSDGIAFLSIPQYSCRLQASIGALL